MTNYIEFRAWDEKRKKMYYLENQNYIEVNENGAKFFVSFIGIDPGITDENLNKYIYWNELSDFILNKYTGVKDKSGNKIYESDIVKFNYNNDYDFEAKVVFKDYIFKGDLDSDKRNIGFVLEWLDNSGFINFPVNVDLKIIGNIYENSDLIKR